MKQFENWLNHSSEIIFLLDIKRTEWKTLQSVFWTSCQLLWIGTMWSCHPMPSLRKSSLIPEDLYCSFLCQVISTSLYWPANSRYIWEIHANILSWILIVFNNYWEWHNDISYTLFTKYVWFDHICTIYLHRAPPKIS